MLAAGVVFLITNNIVILMAAAIIGVISPSGNEIGPFLSVEQAALTQLVPDRAAHAGLRLVQPGRLVCHRHRGARRRLAGPGPAVQAGCRPLDAYRVVLAGYAAGRPDPGPAVPLALAGRRS